ncbi:hypothetical protein OEA_30270 (plasmid) [Priestia megaterium NCT-2]|uniref:hypothetical protein n=1 Tax=Priestia megaterium TaxID=1404 RepID=UPI000EB6F274|nr:hypothetical protein [Priestia megaterium]AYE53901.1 hypothetical protein OEA_30270 [Priestia megaterium NCT-2]
MKGKMGSLFIILIVSILAITALVLTGPFEQPIWMQIVFLFFTSVFAYVTFNKKSKFPFIVLSICSVVTVSSLLISFVS